MSDDRPVISVNDGGPYDVSGGLPLDVQIVVPDGDGAALRYEKGKSFDDAGESYSLCRCGKSNNKPFCDGSHNKVGFKGEEKAPRGGYRERAKIFRGPAESLADDRTLCSVARFCDAGATVWKQVKGTDDAETRERFEAAVRRCPSGRLVLVENEGDRLVDTDLAQAISILEDPDQGCSGPIWVQGGVEIRAADGEAYEIRDRVALCRCGASGNMPFCDGSHAKVGFRDPFLPE